MTAKQSARPHRKSVNRDCFVVFPTPHQHPALLAMTRFGLFQQSRKGGNISWCNYRHCYLIPAMELKHYDHDGRARFVTFSTHQRIPVLTDDVTNDIVVSAILHVCCAYHLRLLAYVIMPEHDHLVVVPPLAAKLGPIVGEMKFSSAMRIHELLIARQSLLLERLQAVRNGVTKFCLWQRRCYDHNCRTESSVWEKVNYCHNNPVRRGLVRNPENWQWSSYFYYRRSDNALVEIDVGCSE